MAIVANPRQYKIPDWFLNRCAAEAVPTRSVQRAPPPGAQALLPARSHSALPQPPAGHGSAVRTAACLGAALLIRARPLAHTPAALRTSTCTPPRSLSPPRPLHYPTPATSTPPPRPRPAGKRTTRTAATAS
jgi:hypothetical protein